MKASAQMMTVLQVLGEIRGLEVKRTLPGEIVAVAHPTREMRQRDAFRRICAYLKEQGVKLEKPSDEVRSKHLAPRVVTVSAVAGEEASPTFNLWFRLPNVTDKEKRIRKAGAVIKRRFFGGGAKRGIVHTLAGKVVIPALSRFSAVREYALR